MKVHPIEVSGQSIHYGKSFPLVLSPETSPSESSKSIDWALENRDEVAKQLREYGAIMFRGFELKTPEDFLNFLKSFNWGFASYIGGGGPRKVVIGPIETSTESPPDVKIPFHHELAYVSQPPNKVVFFCEIPTEKDGETPVLLSSVIIDRLKKENKPFYDKIKEKKVIYHRTLQDRSTCISDYQRAWQDIFYTDDRSLAEERARSSGTNTIEWQDNGDMKVVSIPMDAIHCQQEGKETWFNSVTLLHKASRIDVSNPLWDTTYADGSPILKEDVDSVSRIMDEEGTKIKWQFGDVLLIDNTIALHARSTFTPPRRILATIMN